MAKNYVCEGGTLTFTAPDGGVTAGTPVIIHTLNVIPLETVKAGEPFTGALGGVWQLPATAGLTAGSEAAWDGARLVAADTENAKTLGKLVSDESGGYAEALLVQ